MVLARGVESGPPLNSAPGPFLPLWRSMGLRPLSPVDLTSDNAPMWIDARGSEMLPTSECKRLLALGAKQHHHGHLGIPTDSAPLVLPIDYAIDGSDIVLQVGEGLFAQLSGRLIAFQVDNSSQDGQIDSSNDEGRWSVLVRGLATPVDSGELPDHLPEPRVAEPGNRLVHIRADVLTGRRLREGSMHHGAPAT